MKTQRELSLEYWGRVHNMCNYHKDRYGTDVNPWQCVKLDIDGEDLSCFDDHPVFNAWDKGKYTLAITILEGKPVFIGDKIFYKNSGDLFDWDNWNDDDIDEMQEFCSWNPRRTFTINEWTLPCPEKVINTREQYSFMLNGNTYWFNTREERNQVMSVIEQILINARDKE